MRRPPLPNRPGSGRLSASLTTPLKPADRQPQQPVDPEVEQIARELVKGRELSTVDPAVHGDLIVPLQNARNRALLRRSNSTIKRIDALVAKINEGQKKKPKTVRRPLPPKRPRPRSSSLVKMSTQEKEMYEEVVDQLIAGEQFDEIDASALPKMRQVLKERIKKASQYNDYKTAQQLQMQMDRLVSISRSQPAFVPKPQPKKEFVEEMVQVYVRAMVRVIRLQRRYDKEMNDTRESKSVSSRASSRASGYDGDGSSGGRRSSGSRRCASTMGSYSPSRALADLREKQEQAFAEGRTEEAEELKRNADAVEEIERKQWAEKSSPGSARRGKSERDKRFEELWKKREKDISDRMLPQIRSAQREADKALSQLQVYGIDIPDIPEELIGGEEDEMELEQSPLDGPTTLEMDQFHNEEEEEEEIHSSDFEMLHNDSTSDDAQYSNGGYDQDNAFDDVSSVYMEAPPDPDLAATLASFASQSSDDEKPKKKRRGRKEKREEAEDDEKSDKEEEPKKQEELSEGSENSEKEDKKSEKEEKSEKEDKKSEKEEKPEKEELSEGSEKSEKEEKSDKEEEKKSEKEEKSDKEDKKSEPEEKLEKEEKSEPEADEAQEKSKKKKRKSTKESTSNKSGDAGEAPKEDTPTVEAPDVE